VLRPHVATAAIDVGHPSTKDTPQLTRIEVTSMFPCLRAARFCLPEVLSDSNHSSGVWLQVL
jgi:hypothetical protein